MSLDIICGYLDAVREATLEKLADSVQLRGYCDAYQEWQKTAEAPIGEVLPPEAVEDPRTPQTTRRPEGAERARRLAWVAARPALAVGGGMLAGFGAAHGVGSAYKRITGNSISPETLRTIGIGSGSLGTLGMHYLLNRAVPTAIERAEAGYDDY